MHLYFFFSCFLCDSASSDCLLSDAESSSSDGPVADKRAPGSERAAERAAQQNERERIRLVPQTSFANMQVKHFDTTLSTCSKCEEINLSPVFLQAFDYEQKKLLATKGQFVLRYM